MLDTNVLVSAALGNGPARRLLVLLASTGRLVTSFPILEEFSAVLTKSTLAKRVLSRLAAKAVSFVELHGSIVRPGRLDWPENPKDAQVVATALAAEATLVSGDRFVLDQAVRIGVRALAVRNALEELASW